MPKPGKIIPLLPLKRIMLESGVHRVSKDALVLLSDYLEEYASWLGKRAIIFAEHSDRITLRKKDIISADRIKSLG